MIEKIGENAGRVYEFLRGKEKVPVKTVVKGTGLKAQEIDRALGWLARENKIRLELDKKDELVTLTE